MGVVVRFCRVHSAGMANAHDTREIHTVVGAGQIGRKVANLLLERGHQVRLVRRGPAGSPRPGLAWMRGDITDSAFADQACRGAAVVYNCANAADYHRWDGVLQPLFNGVRHAAGRAGARLVVLDNLYMVGRPESVPFDEDTPMRPCSDKGRLRAELVEQLFAAHARGDVRATCGRASDFFGPDSPLSVIASPRFFARLAAGKSAEVFGDPDLPRAYSYTPDVARGLVELGADERSLGRVWHLPVCHTGTTRELVTAFYRAAGKQPRMHVVPRWMLRGVGLLSPTVRAALEMLYQWEIPYVPDDARFVAEYGVRATALAEAVATTVHAELPAQRRAA